MFILFSLTQIEKMLIARVHVFIKIRQIRSVQYKYKSHITNFLRNTSKIYDSLPLLSRDLKIIFFRFTNAEQNPYLNR
jgi:hypothetical protein